MMNGMATAKEVEYEEEPDGVDPESLTAWQVYGRIRNKNARKYLLELANAGESEGWRLLIKLGMTTGNPSTAQSVILGWRERYAGFAELEKRLIENPAMAGRFFSICLLPVAAHYMGEVLLGRIKGNRQEAAKFIINLSGAARADARLADAQMTKAAPNTRTLLQRFEAAEAEKEEGEEDGD